MKGPISSLAIAGAWGYIGRKFFDAARRLQWKTIVYDTGQPPGDLDLAGVTLCDTESEFYRQQSDLFHLALHPEHRANGLRILLQRSHAQPLWILCEKPMAAPESPEDCARTARAIALAEVVVLYDFPELFDPITKRILEFFDRHDDVRIHTLQLQRSKDREDPTIPRNRKTMVHIQYQETVHCLAFALHVLLHLERGLEPVLAQGLRVSAHARPYNPPNPSAYPHAVDGKCEYRVTLGDIRIDGQTDFTRGAPWRKRRLIRGVADGRDFSIEADFLEDDKLLVINGRRQDDVVDANSYMEVLKTLSQLRQAVSPVELMSGPYPNPTFAHLTYQLSSVLWRSSWDETELLVASLPDLLSFDAAFAEARSRFAHY